MGSKNSVWIVIAADEVSDRARELVDKGAFAEAKDIDYQLKSIAEQLKSFAQEKGGSLLIATYDRFVLEAPITVAEILPNIISGYKSTLGSRLAVGIGMDLLEASKAARKSTISGDIELYDPTDDSFKLDYIEKNAYELDEEITLSPNLYDHTNPGSPEPSDREKTNKLQYKPGLNPQQSIQAEAQLISAIVDQLNAPAQQVQQQMQQQMQQQQQQQQPNDLLEALHGGQVPGHTPEQKDDSDKSPKKDSKASGSEDKSPKKDTSSDDDDDSKEDESESGLKNLLGIVNEKVPQLMNLAETNPEAFKKVIGLVHKIVDMSKRKSVSKGEVKNLAEELNKKIEFPVGTLKNGKKKVIVNGRSVWRSVRSGLVRDNQGEPVSVKSSNAAAKTGEEGSKNE